MARRPPRNSPVSGDYHSMRRRLWNWGRWARINPDAPDGSCANPLYDMMVKRAEGWGDDHPPPNIRPTQAAIEQPDIDEPDAENLDCLILQTPRPHRILLVRVYVLRIGEGSRLDVDAAIRAIWDVVAANRAAVEEVKKHGLR